MPHVLLKPGGSRSLWSATGGGKWQPGTGPWHLSEVMEGSRSMEGNVPFFSFFSPPLLNDGQQRSGDGHQGRSNQPHISAKSHLLDRNSLPPHKILQGPGRAGWQRTPEPLATGAAVLASLWNASPWDPRLQPRSLHFWGPRLENSLFGFMHLHNMTRWP